MKMVLPMSSPEIRVWLGYLESTYTSSNDFHLHFETRRGGFGFILWEGVEGMRGEKRWKDYSKNTFTISQGIANRDPWAKFGLQSTYGLQAKNVFYIIKWLKK